MLIEAISFQGFRSFMDDEIMKIPKAPGVYLITGENQLEPKLGANGVGKSSFAEGLCWCFYGKTSKGHKANDIVNWAGEHMTIVTVDLTVNDEESNVTRRQKPNSLTWQKVMNEPEVVEQYEIENRLGLSYDLFLATVLFAQDGDSFMKLGSTAQAKALANVLGLSVWEERSKRAKDTVAAAEKDKKKLEDSVLRVKAENKALVAQYNSICEKEESWQEEQDKEIKVLTEQLEEAGKAQVDAFAAVEKATLASREIGDSGQGCEKEFSKLEKKLGAKQAALQTLNFRKIELDTKIELKEVEKKRLERVCDSGGGECPTCGTEIHVSVAENDLVKVESATDSLIIELSGVDEKIRKYNADIGRIKGRLSNVSDEREVFARQRSDAARHYQGCLDKKYGADEAIKDLNKQIKKAKKVTNPHASTLDEMDAKIDKLKKRRKGWEAELCKLEHVIDRNSYWIQGFLRIRLWILERAMAEFAVKMSNSFEQLGLQDWKVFCQTEKQLKDGTKKPAFNITIQSPASPDPIAWGLWSGGEEQRLNIAGNAAFSDLVCDRMGIRPSMEIWDEPTQHLSPGGCGDLMQFFKHRALVLGKQVWVIDHRTIDSGEVDGHWHFVKDYRGTHIHCRT